MQTKISALFTAAAIGLVACGGGEKQQQPAAAAPAAAAPAAAATDTTTAKTAVALPPGVTDAMVAEGNTVFHGPGNCFTCHGQNGQGVTGLGPNLGDSEWLHSDGSYDAIVAQIKKGVPPTESKSGVAMPPRGGSTITDDQVKAVAAYVYSLRGGAS
jgi:cytochrome c oxidase cbb3-type subunit 3